MQVGNSLSSHNLPQNTSLLLNNIGTGYGGGNNSFISPIRAISNTSMAAAVPSHHLQNPQVKFNQHLLSSASNLMMAGGFAKTGPSQSVGVANRVGQVALSAQLQREIQSSSPFGHLNKKRAGAGGTLERHQTQDEEHNFPTQQHGAGSALGNPNHRMQAYNMITLEDAERKCMDLIDNEKQQFKKKELATREFISELQKKLKQSEKRHQEEQKLTGEFKKRHEIMRKKLEKTMKEKSDSINQLKSLFTLFTQQKKALEVSIQKTKRLEEDNAKLESRNKSLEEQRIVQQRKVDHLEQEREQLILKQKREREQIEQELEEKRSAVKKYESEFKEISNHKLIMKKQLDEYEMKVKRLILEFEEESKKHIRELNEVHEQYRGYKSASLELEQRISQYKADAQKAQEAERNSKKELHRVNLENDELRERLKFIDQRYNSLVQRFGASPEDLQEIEEQIMKNHPIGHEDDVAQVIYPGKKRGNASANARNQANIHMKNQQSEKSHPFQKLVDVRQVKQLVMDSNDDQQQTISDRNYNNGKRGQSRQANIDGTLVSGEQVIEHGKKTGPVAASTVQVNKQMQLAAGKYMNSNVSQDSEQLDSQHNNQYYNESFQLLQKIMENLRGNPALQNEYIKKTFKLNQIKGESDLQDKKNLLNSMAALYYTNHRMGTANQLFYIWKEAASIKQEERMRQIQVQQSQKKGTKPLKIQIDTELANQEAFKNYHQVNHDKVGGLPPNLQNPFIDDEPSEIPVNDDLRKNMMIHIEGDDQLDMLNDEEPQDEDYEEQMRDKKARKFFEDLQQVGRTAKHILNYSYPPLLYQRGDGEEDEQDDEDQMDEDDDDAAVREILEGGDDGEGIRQLPEFQDEFEDEDDEGGLGEEEIQELIKAGVISEEALQGMDNQELYSKIRKAIEEGNLPGYENMLQVHGGDNVFIQNYDDAMYGQELDGDYEEGQHMMGGEDLDDEEFLQMMEQDPGRMMRGHNPGQQNSTIINSSQNTSLEDNFIVE